MSEEPQNDQYVYPTSDSIPPPPRRKKAKRKRALAQLAPADVQAAKEIKARILAPPPEPQRIALLPTGGSLTLESIQAAKAIIAQAEAALGVTEKKKVLPLPTHPPHLEDPAQGDKTPAVVQWYRDHDRAAYEERYAGRKTHIEDKRKARRYEPMPGGATPATFPADPDGFTLSQRDDSGRAPRNTADL